MPKLGVPLTDDQKRKIADLFASLQAPLPSRIALRIGRDVRTVRWHMMTNGMYHKKPGRAPSLRHYVVNGVPITVYPWGEDHDAFIQAQRLAGLSCAKIAAAVTAQFGIERKGHSVRARLVLLATAD